MSDQQTSAPRSPGFFRSFFAGVGLLGQGLRVWVTAPKLMFLGVVPALIVGAVFIALLVIYGLNLETIAAWVTPFAEQWDEPFRTGTRFIAGFGLLAGGIFLLVFAFTAVTLIVGDLFYEKIWEHVERREGELPSKAVKGFWPSLGRGLGDALRTLVPTVFAGIGILLLGFIPVVGQVLSPVLAALLGGWFLTVELSGRAFDAHGMTLRQRRKLLGSQRATSLGFGVATYLLFLIPLGAVLVMPAAVAGATLLARRLAPEQSQQPEQPTIIAPDGA